MNISQATKLYIVYFVHMWCFNPKFTLNKQGKYGIYLKRMKACHL
jgi:hypothetical protein